MKYRNAGIKTQEEAMKRLIDGEVFRVVGGTFHNDKIMFDKDYLRSTESPFRFVTENHNIAVQALWGFLEQWNVSIDPLKESTRENPVLAYRWNGDDRPAYPVAAYIYFEYSSSPHAFCDLFGNRWKNAELVPMSDCAEWEGGDERE